MTGRLFLRGLGMEGREGEGDASDPLESNRDNLEGGIETDALRDVDGCYNYQFNSFQMYHTVYRCCTLE